jgi:ABC-type Fe3+ transport system permease subunit
MRAEDLPARVLGTWRSRFFSICVLLLVSFFLLLPLGALLFRDGGVFRSEIAPATANVWTAGSTWGLLGKSLLMSALVTLLASTTGTFEALLYFRSRFRGRKFLFFLSLFPLFVQPVLIAVGLIRMSESGGSLAGLLNSLSSLFADSVRGNIGVVLVLWIGLRPLVTLCVGANLRSIPAEMEESALLDAQPARVAVRLSLRLALPGIIVGALLVFLRSTLESAVPAVFTVKAYAFETFAMLGAFYDEASALAFATPLLAVGIILGISAAVGVNALAVRGLSFIRSPVLFPEGWRRTACVLLSMLWVFPFWLLSGWGLLHPGRLIGSLSATWPNVQDEIARTVVDSASAMLVVLLIAFLAAATASYGVRILRSLTKCLFALPLLIPPVLLGVGMVVFWNQPGWRGDLASSPVVLIMGKALLLLPIVAWPIVAILATMERDLIESLALDGGGWRAFVRYLLFPAVRPHLPLLGLIAFLLAFGEFEVSTLLSPPGWTPFSVRLFTLLHYGVDDVVAGLSLVGFAGTVLVAFLAAWMTRIRFLPD